MNSLFISTSSTIITLFFSFITSHGIARLKNRIGHRIGLILLLFYLIPTSILFFPLFTTYSGLGLADNLLFLSLLNCSFLIPFATWMMLSYLKSIPENIYNASYLDGCSLIKSMLTITLPLSKKSILITGIFCFILSWNEYIYALVFLQNPNYKTITIGISSLQTGDVFEWGVIMAAGIISIIPIILFYLFVQKYFISAFSLGFLTKTSE